MPISACHATRHLFIYARRIFDFRYITICVDYDAGGSFYGRSIYRSLLPAVDDAAKRAAFGAISVTLLAIAALPADMMMYLLLFASAASRLDSADFDGMRRAADMRR